VSFKSVETVLSERAAGHGGKPWPTSPGHGKSSVRQGARSAFAPPRLTSLPFARGEEGRKERREFKLQQPGPGPGPARLTALQDLIEWAPVGRSCAGSDSDKRLGQSRGPGYPRRPPSQRPPSPPVPPPPGPVTPVRALSRAAQHRLGSHHCRAARAEGLMETSRSCSQHPAQPQLPAAAARRDRVRAHEPGLSQGLGEWPGHGVVGPTPAAARQARESCEAIRVAPMEGLPPSLKSMQPRRPPGLAPSSRT
jgi:hypothetical protein